MPTILESDGIVKDLVEWSTSFDSILNHPRFLAYYNDEAGLAVVYDLIDMLCRIEIEMPKVMLISHLASLSKISLIR